MTICKPNDIKLRISSKQRLLGLDIGKKTIGLALSDFNLKIATPLQTISRTKFTLDVHVLLSVIDEQDIGGLIVGWPLNMNGSVGSRCDSVRDFVHEFLKIRQLPIVLQDERLSTSAVESAMLSANMTRIRRAKSRDALAACWILQSLLDLLNHSHID